MTTKLEVGIVNNNTAYHFQYHVWIPKIHEYTFIHRSQATPQVSLLLDSILVPIYFNLSLIYYILLYYRQTSHYIFQGCF